MDIDLVSMKSPPTDNSRRKTFAYYASVLILFVIVHLTVNRIEWLLNLWTSDSWLSRYDLRTDLILFYAPLLKSILFTGALLIVSFPIFANIVESLRKAQRRESFVALGVAAAAIVLLGILVFNPGTDNMGRQYARMSSSPFAEKANWFNTRLLMPFLGYIFHLRGQWPYYVFSVVLSAVFIALLYGWNKDGGMGLTFWQLVSLSTCSFVIFQLQMGGYPDILVFIFFILVMQKNMKQDAKLSLLILALLTHESSALIGIILAWKYLERDKFIAYLGSILTYAVLWNLFSRIYIDGILISHNVNDRTGWEWVLRRPMREVFGVLVSFKAVWILVIAGITIAWRKKMIQDLLFMLACIAAGILMTILGVDTARMMSFAFPGFLVGIGILAQQLAGDVKRRLFNGVFFLNILIPSVYIGLIGTVEFSPGLYRFVFGPLFTLLSR